MRAWCLCLLLLGLPSAARAADAFDVAVRARTFRPGELMVFTMSVPPPVAEVRVVLFERTAPAYRLDGDRWQAMVGIDLDQRAGVFEARIDAIDGTTLRQVRRPITIARRQFPTRNLRVAPDFVNPPREQLERIETEQAFTRGIYEHPTAQRLWSGTFVRPVPQEANSRFGTRSVYNGERRSPHAGTDFMSPAGTPIKSPNAGRIVCARELFFTGNTVIIDHGLGVFSLMAHLSRLDVKEGADVQAGDLLGLVGATGRVTGPHLHWAMAVSGARVDPLSVLALLGPAATP